MGRGQEMKVVWRVKPYFLNLEAPELDLVIEAAVQSKSQTASTSNSLRAAIAHSFIVWTLSVVFWTIFCIHANSADDLSTLTSK